MTNRTTIRLDCPDDGGRPSSYPFFIEDNIEHLRTPTNIFFLRIRPAGKPLALTSFFNGKREKTRVINSTDEVHIPLAELVPLIPGDASFEVAGEAVETVTTSFKFVSDYTGAYEAHRRRQYEATQARRERERLASLCPPPADGQTWDTLIENKRAEIQSHASCLATSCDEGSSGIWNIHHAMDFETNEASSFFGMAQEAVDFARKNLRDAEQLVDLLKQLEYLEQEKQAASK